MVMLSPPQQPMGMAKPTTAVQTDALGPASPFGRLESFLDMSSFTDTRTLQTFQNKTTLIQLCGKC